MSVDLNHVHIGIDPDLFLENTLSVHPVTHKRLTVQPAFQLKTFFRICSTTGSEVVAHMQKMATRLKLKRFSCRADKQHPFFPTVPAVSDRIHYKST